MKYEEILKYKNQKVITRYQTDFPGSKLKADEAFSELMKYIYLCHIHAKEQETFPENESLQFRCVIHSEMSDLDNMWHTFLIFTRDYEEFCRDYLGGFFHHEPLSDEHNLSNDNYELDLTRYLSFICDNLGEETLIKWFTEP